MLKKGLIITLSIIALFVLIGFMSYTSAVNGEVTLRQKTIAQQEVCKANYDKMFKTIAQVAQIPGEFMDKAKGAFKEIYQPLIEGRYAKGDGTLMKWITESNPKFDLDQFGQLYAKLEVAIESNREEYFGEQRKLIDFKREHDTYINMWWNKHVWLDSNIQEIPITIITSAKTKEAYATGEENDISLFKKDTTKGK